MFPSLVPVFSPLPLIGRLCEPCAFSRALLTLVRRGPSVCTFFPQTTTGLFQNGRATARLFPRLFFSPATTILRHTHALPNRLSFDDYFSTFPNRGFSESANTPTLEEKTRAIENSLESLECVQTVSIGCTVIKSTVGAGAAALIEVSPES